MSNKNHTRRISTRKLRKFLDRTVEDFCSLQERVSVALDGNSFAIHFEGATINITIFEPKGGEM